MKNNVFPNILFICYYIYSNSIKNISKGDLIMDIAYINYPSRFWELVFGIEKELQIAENIWWNSAWKVLPVSNRKNIREILYYRNLGF